MQKILKVKVKKKHTNKTEYYTIYSIIEWKWHIAHNTIWIYEHYIMNVIHFIS